LRFAIVGAGINGVMSAWALLEKGHEVVLFERDDPIGATSQASTKLLHGGLRYLEHGDFALVREGLRARAWWLENAPCHTRTLEIAIPLYRGSRRWRLTLKSGLLLYQWLAGRHSLGGHRWMSAADLSRQVPQLRTRGLRGAYVFRDGQMDDQELGRWALQRIVQMGAQVRAQTPVERIDPDGEVTASTGRERFDAIVNACGPWAASLLENSGMDSPHRLDLVRGSHLLVSPCHRLGFLVESPDDGRPCFVLPYQGHTLIGTTEVRQRLDEPVKCSSAERAYLMRLYDAYFDPCLGPDCILSDFAGIRPLVASRDKSANALTRESAIVRQGRTLTIYGGKWTTSRELGLRVAEAVRECLART
jgi:glycerol-3-phosphate dehydrogenase